MVHRADFIDLLVRTAEMIPNITIKTGAKVVGYDCEGARVQTEDGTWHSGDLVIAADGESNRISSFRCSLTFS